MPSDRLEISGDCGQRPCVNPLCQPGGVTGQLQYLPGPGSQISKRAVSVSVELGRILAETDRIKFRASGTCMYPVIKPGDILSVDPKDISRITVGDIAVYKRNDQLFGHRILKKEMDNGRTYVVTKADRAAQGSKDGPFYAEDVLGVVAHIERSGKPVSTKPRDFSLTKKIYFDLCAGFLECLSSCLPKFVHGLTRLQQTGLYREFARRWFEYSKPDLTYSVRVPFGSWHRHGLHRRLTLTEFKGTDFLSLRAGSKYFILELLASDQRRPAVSATFVSRPPGCGFAGWRLDELSVRISYRGAGLEEKLLAEARKVLGESGVREFWVGPNVQLPGSPKGVRAFAI